VCKEVMSVHPETDGRSPADTSDANLPALGPHGEGWVAGQVVLIGAILVFGLAGPSWPRAVAPAATTVGVLLLIVGLGVMVLGAGALGRSLTPLPKPRQTSSLTDGGIFGWVRHPMYGGALVAALGWSFAASPVALLPTAAAGLFVELKSRREELWLCERYPRYASYRRRVRWKFVPGIR
jgi:protein-S-isoprenylcysteine O-methyltransferase Ste14